MKGIHRSEIPGYGACLRPFSIPASLASLLAAFLFTGCAEIRLGTDSNAPVFEMKGVGTAYATVTEVPPYDGTILRGSIFRGGANTGELASVSIWPLGELGLGLLGIRGRLFAFEGAVGTLFYQPQPPTKQKAGDKEEKPVKPARSKPTREKEKGKEKEKGDL